MKYIDEFRDRRLIDKMARQIRDTVDDGRAYNFMEVCGTHTMEIGRLGLRSLLPENVELISGPGCPVCVTPAAYIDAAADLALKKNARLATFGDMVRVPGDHTSIDEARSKGAVVDVVTSPLNALEIARQFQTAPEHFLYLGDSGVDMDTATSAGMFPVGALWGFRDAEELERFGARALIRRPGELLALLG